MYVACRCVAFRQQQHLFAGARVPGDVHHHHGMSVLVAGPVRSRIHKNISGLYYRERTLLQFAAEREGVGHTIDLPEIFFKFLSGGAARIFHGFPVDIVEADFTVSATFEEVFRAEPHAGVGTLLRVGEHGHIHHRVAQELVVCRVSGVEHHHRPFPFQRQRAEKRAIGRVAAVNPLITVWNRNLSDSLVLNSALVI